MRPVLQAVLNGPLNFRIRNGIIIPQGPMSFYQKYDLERLIADGDAKTFRAKENATGQQVLLHLFNPGGEPILAAIKAKLGGAPGKPAWPLLEIGDFAGSPYAVTDVIEPFTTLRDWVATVGAAPLPGVPMGAPRPAPPAAPVASPSARAQSPLNPDEQFSKRSEAAAAPKPAQEPGEFTRLFDIPAEKPPVKPGVPQAKQPQADTFENLFGAGGDAKPQAQPRPPQAPAAKQPQADTFENMFGFSGDARAQAQPRSPAPPAARAADPHTGEFTRLFGRSPLGEQINIEEEQARAARAAPPENRPFQAPGDFTRMFGPEMQTSAPQPVQPAHRRVSETASGIFAPINVPSKPAAPSGEPPAGAAGLANATPAEPDEYMRTIAIAPETDQPGAGKPPEPVPVQPTAKRGLVIGLSIGAAVLVIIIIVVVIFAVRGK